jgi:hypothetical protein
VKQIRKRLTYANVMSSIAVFLVLGGATAMAAGLAKNSVGSKQLKKNAVTTKKIKNNAVTTAKIKNGAITGAKVNLGSLGTVPNAAHASSADSANSAGNADTVDGQHVVKIFSIVQPGTSNQTIANLAGFILRGDCSAGGNVEDLELDPPNNVSDLKAFGSGNIESFFDTNQGTENNSLELSEANERGETAFSAATLSGTVISGNIGYDDEDSFDDTAACAVYGQVLVG